MAIEKLRFLTVASGDHMAKFWPWRSSPDFAAKVGWLLFNSKETKRKNYLLKEHLRSPGKKKEQKQCCQLLNYVKSPISQILPICELKNNQTWRKKTELNYFHESIFMQLATLNENATSTNSWSNSKKSGWNKTGGGHSKWTD